MPGTPYIVLKHDTEDTWLVHNSVDAPSATAAIRQVAGGSGTYVAVPIRSWAPVTVTTETRTILKLEQPDTAA
jgi:hypothetical protein